MQNDKKTMQHDVFLDVFQKLRDFAEKHENAEKDVDKNKASSQEYYKKLIIAAEKIEKTK